QNFREDGSMWHKGMMLAAVLAAAGSARAGEKPAQEEAPGPRVYTYYGHPHWIQRGNPIPKYYYYHRHVGMGYQLYGLPGPEFTNVYPPPYAPPMVVRVTPAPPPMVDPCAHITVKTP